MFICYCPKCGQKFEADDELDGRETACPTCLEIFTAKRPSSPAQNPASRNVGKKAKTRLRACPDCGNPISRNATFCPHCGLFYPTCRWIITLFKIFLVLFFIAAIAGAAFNAISGMGIPNGEY